MTKAHLIICLLLAACDCTPKEPPVSKAENHLPENLDNWQADPIPSHPVKNSAAGALCAEVFARVQIPTDDHEHVLLCRVIKRKVWISVDDHPEALVLDVDEVE
jgi:hypothetical protein